VGQAQQHEPLHFTTNSLLITPALLPQLQAKRVKFSPGCMGALSTEQGQPGDAQPAKGGQGGLCPEGRTESPCQGAPSGAWLLKWDAPKLRKRLCQWWEQSWERIKLKMLLCEGRELAAAAVSTDAGGLLKAQGAPRSPPRALFSPATSSCPSCPPGGGHL